MPFFSSSETSYLNSPLKFIVLVLFLFTAYIQNIFANDFIVTGHVYANPNEFKYILEQTKEQDVDTLYILGDMEDIVLNKIEYYENLYNISIHIVPGNHEITDNKETNKYTEKYGSYKAFTKLNQLNIFLNTMDSNKNRFSHNGYSIQGKQLKFLQNALEGAAENIHTINIFMHHALFLDRLTIEEQEIVSNNKLNKLNPEELKRHAKKKGYSSFLSNHTVRNSWHEDVYPILKKELENGKKINVFSGDNSISAIFKNNEINYYLTGLRQHSKPAFTQDNMQSFLKCESNSCKIIFFDNFQPELTLMDDFIYKLNLLNEKKPHFTANISKDINIENLNKFTYIFLEKSDQCFFPTSISIKNLKDKKIENKLYSGFNVNQNKRLYLINRTKSDDNQMELSLDGIQEGDKCKDFKIKFYDHDYNYFLNAFDINLDNYLINVDDDDLQDIHFNLPTIHERQDRYTRYQFPSIKGNINESEKNYPIKLKLRGGTRFHWKYDKKSHALKYKNNKRPKKIFYIPEKRAIFGEYLIHKLSHFIGLESLDQSYGYLNINNHNNGLYFVTNIYDKFFLQSHKLPEANIYHTDSFSSRLANFEVENVKKNMFIGGIKQYRNRFDDDIDYFLNVIKSDDSYLKNNWKKHFDENNLTKILSILLLSGSAHYDLHNLYFYINPSNGKIYFLPWDFMNFSNAQKIDQLNNEANNIDYKNYNEILSKLLNIGEVRFLRNKFIYKNAKKMRQFIQAFYDEELPFIMSKMILDETVPFSFDNGARSIFSFMNIPKIIISNIDFQFNRIKKNYTTLDFDAKRIGPKNLKLNLNLTSYSGIILEELIFQKKDGSYLNMPLNKKKLFSVISYEQKYGAPVKIITTNHQLNISIDDLSDFEEVELIYSNFFAANDNKAINSNIDDSDERIEHRKNSNFNKYRQLFKVDGNNIFFKGLDISLQQNVILPEGLTLNIKPGTTIRMGKNISLITYGSITASGTKDSPIKFIPLDDDSPWGVVAMVGGDSSNIFENCFFSGGSGAYSNGKYFSGMLSAYHVNKIKISECKFTNSYKDNGGDDAVNIKNTLANIKNSSFFSNEGDAIDVDYVTNGSSIINSTFMSNKNDGIDVSYSRFQINGSRIKYNRDKGISIGEDSIVTLTNANVLKNKIGIAIKDGSDVLIDKSNISKNIVGIGLYNKKENFSSPKVRINSTIVNNNYVNCGVESTNRFGNKPALIFTDKEIDKKGNEYRYILKSNIKKMSKKSVIKEALGSSWKNKSIEYILFNECNL